MHYGFWDETTQSRDESILNQNKAVISLGSINSRSKVLDLGCGVGGTALYIAEHAGAHVTGITLDPKQVKSAQENAQKRGLSKKTNFLAMDFMKLEFPSDSFDVVYAVESACYSYPKEAFLKGIFRVLKPGGRLIIMDGYPTKPKNSGKAKEVLDGIIWGFRLAPMITASQLTALLSRVGYVSIEQHEKTEDTTPSVRYYGTFATIMMPIAKVLSYLPFSFLKATYWNTVAVKNVWESYKLGVGGYYLHVATKPR